MTTPATTLTTTPAPLAKVGIAAALVAAVATLAVASIASASGVSLDIAREPIPLLAFPELTLVFSLIGVGIAAVLSRRAARARTGFLHTTGGLLLVSFVPDLLADAAVSTKLTLLLCHVVAAAVMIPVLASRLSD